MISQKSTKNNDNNMDHQQRVAQLKSILSDVLDFALNETSFRSPDVLENVIASYMDVSEYMRFIAFRFPDIQLATLHERLYGLGLHLENEGLANVNMNPNYSAMAKFGEGLQQALSEFGVNSGLSDEVSQALRVAAKRAVQSHSISDDIADIYMDRIGSLGHAWVVQVLDAWEIENDRRKVHCADIDNWDLRAMEMEVCKQHDAMIDELRKEADALNDIRSYLESSYEPFYNVQNNSTKLSYPEDIKAALVSLKSAIIDKEKALAITDQIILEGHLSFRSIKPGDRPASELIPLRDLLMGRKIFREGADIEALIEKADKEARTQLKGKPDFFHQEYERSLKDTKAALSHLKRKPIFGKAVTLDALPL